MTWSIILAWGWSSTPSRPLNLKALQALHVVFENSWSIPNLFVNWDRILSLFLNLVSLELKGKVLFSKGRILHLFKRKKKQNNKTKQKNNLCCCHSPSTICLKIWGKIRKWWVALKVILHSLKIVFKHLYLMMCWQCQKIRCLSGTDLLFIWSCS